jgi:hypothetical protein
VADLDWGAVQGIGTVLAAAIAVVALRAASRAAESERERNAEQAELDSLQGENLKALAQAVRKMADVQEGQLLDLARRLAELEAERDPDGSEGRRRELAAQQERAAGEMRELDRRLERIVLLRRDGLAGGGWSAATRDRKRVIRLTNQPAAANGKCRECNAPLAVGALKCAECGQPTR